MGESPFLLEMLQPESEPWEHWPVREGEEFEAPVEPEAWLSDSWPVARLRSAWSSVMGSDVAAPAAAGGGRLAERSLAESIVASGVAGHSSGPIVDAVFHVRHPDRKGKPLTSQDAALVQEW